MNLDTYQKFLEYLGVLKLQRKILEPNFDKPENLRKTIRENFEKQGITEGSSEMTDFDYNLANALKFMPDAHTFEIDTIMKRLLCRTQAPTTKKQISQIHLPFDYFFIDVELTPDELPPDLINRTNRILGFLIVKMSTYDDAGAIPNAMLRPLNILNPEGKRSQRYHGDAMRVYCVSTTEDDMTGLIWNEYPLTTTNRYAYNDDLSPFIKNFIYNFLMFIVNRDVELIHFHRTSKNRESRLKAGKIPLPDSTRIVIKGNIKHYVDNNPECFTEHAPARKHWVMGHQRFLRSIYYKNKQNQTIWIPAFIRGRGDLITQTRSIEHTRKDKAVISDTLYYSDIPALDKPLKEIQIEKHMKALARKNKRHELSIQKNIHPSSSIENNQKTQEETP